jgi:hypothetical protein
VLQVAGISLINTESADWLTVLQVHGPAATGGDAQGPLPDDLGEPILNNPARYPLQWITIAETSRSHPHTESPLLAAASNWFDD